MQQEVPHPKFIICGVTQTTLRPASKARPRRPTDAKTPVIPNVYARRRADGTTAFQVVAREVQSRTFDNAADAFAWRYELVLSGELAPLAEHVTAPPGASAGRSTTHPGSAAQGPSSGRAEPFTNNHQGADMAESINGFARCVNKTCVLHDELRDLALVRDTVTRKGYPNEPFASIVLTESTYVHAANDADLACPECGHPCAVLDQAPVTYPKAINR